MKHLRNEPKGVVLKLLLTELQKLIPLDSAQVATLGGKGFEANIWLEAGVPPENGWLIEKDSKRLTGLIKGLPFHIVGELENFARVFKAVNGSEDLHFFHCDLCGSLEPSAHLLEPVIPLLLSGSSKLLAITVSDARRNLSQENFPLVFESAKQFSSESQTVALFEKLFHEQVEIPRLLTGRLSNPEKGAQREFGVYYTLANLLTTKAFEGWSVGNIHRYIYRSKAMITRPWPLRTYLFRFTECKSKPIGKLINTWNVSPLIYVADDGSMQTSDHKKESNMSIQIDSEAFPNLSRLFELIGDEVKTEIEAFIQSRVDENSAPSDEFAKKVRELYQLVGGQSNHATAPVIDKLEPPAVVDQTSLEFERDEFGVPVCIDDDFTKIQFALLRAKATIKEKPKYDKFVAKLHRFYKVKFGNETDFTFANLRTHLAKSQKANMPGFISKLVKSFTEEQRPSLFSELAEYYHELDRPVKIKQLEKIAAEK